MSEAATRMATCAACGAVRAGPYCQSCGQASAQAQRPLREIVTGQTGRIVHTLATLLRHPGELARQIDEGRDRRAVRPLTLLLNLVPLFFLIGGGVGGFNAKAFMDTDPSGRLTAHLAQRSRALDVPQLVVQERVEQRFRTVYSLLVVVQAFAYGCAIGLLERRKHKSWATHFAAAIHYLCFSFLAATVVFGAGRLIGVDSATNGFAALVLYAAVVSYMSATLRGAYDEPVPVAIAKGVALLLFGYVVAVLLSVTALLMALYTV